MYICIYACVRINPERSSRYAHCPDLDLERARDWLPQRLPETLNPTPEILNPKPQTSHPLANLSHTHSQT